MSNDRPANRLADEKSPYLQQHAKNPVDWYPWGEEAFAAARDRNVPIFLSIGYATCHWCHVMERESFEDEKTAALMNRYFVNVKVDREERPDVDRIYMTYVQASTGGGGWPMSVWLTPQLKPFLGGTYFPPQSRPGAPGFPMLLQRVHEAWASEPERILEGATRTLEALADAVTRDGAAGSQAEVDAALERAPQAGLDWFRKAYDPRDGGFGGAPKFPRNAAFHFLLREHARGGEDADVAMVLHTLRQMARGGMWDHLGGGFHRYSVDGQWHVPHFEKMLYDQAQLAETYLEAFQLTGDEGFAEVARQTLDYVLRDLTDPDTGAFFSAEDADSYIGEERREKREGAFYVWTDTELRARLGADYELFADHYGIRPNGNAEDPHGELLGMNVLHQARGLPETAERHGLAPGEAARHLADARQILFRVRERRPRPLRDDKVLCAWNGMMIGALARGSMALSEPRYLEAATRAATFAREQLYDAERGRLLRRYCAGEAAFDAYLEDYAQLAAGLLALYEAGFESQWLRWAVALAERAVSLFYDEEGGGFYATAGDDESLLLRLKDDYDGAEPSGNSVLVAVLARLAVAADRPDLQDLAEKTVQAFSETLAAMPHTLPQLVSAAGLVRRRPVQVVVQGTPGDPRFDSLARAARDGHVPDRLICHLEGPDPSAHVCRDTACSAPSADPAALRSELAPRTVKTP